MSSTPSCSNDSIFTEAALQRQVIPPLPIRPKRALIGSDFGGDRFLQGRVRRGLKTAGIALREHGQHHGRPSQAKYGTRVVKGLARICLAEKRVIHTAQGLHAQGMTLRVIASTFDGLKIPTKNRGRAWHPEMVRRLLAEAARDQTNEKFQKSAKVSSSSTD